MIVHRRLWGLCKPKSSRTRWRHAPPFVHGRIKRRIFVRLQPRKAFLDLHVSHRGLDRTRFNQRQLRVGGHKQGNTGMSTNRKYRHAGLSMCVKCCLDVYGDNSIFIWIVLIQKYLASRKFLMKATVLAIIWAGVFHKSNEPSRANCLPGPPV